jgi:hypothetical protein
MRNNKLLELIEKGLTLQSAKNLTESEINVLHKKIIGEQVTPLPATQPLKIGDKGGTLPGNNKGYTLKPNPNDNSITATPNEGEMREGKKKKSDSDVFSICHSQVGPKKTRKFERCVQAVKKILKEGKNPVSLFLENEIMRIVEKHIPPRITKGDLLQYLSEDTTTKPKTKPTTKPTTKPRPKSPGHNPNPGENPAPKAISPERAKTEVINAIMKILDNE